MQFPEAFLLDVDETHNVKNDLSRFDSVNLWNVMYERLKNRSTLLNNGASCDAARSINNRWKNRYRDISPYDDNRVILRTAFDGDYINASYVSIPDVPTKRFILTQGPMQQTASHFWLMVWECRSPVIVMLNRIYEKGVMRCFPYFPYRGGPSFLIFEDVDLRVRLEEETDMQFFTRRTFELTHLQSNDQHHVTQMHYTNWPDFGVPSSPSGILNFLWAVRATGSMSDPVHPPIVHCSAGVGRSGAFVLIDLALQQVEQQGSIDNLDLSRLFLELRRCRMGVIQTSDQLRFCYAAVARGADELLRTPTEQIPYIKFQPQEDEEKRLIECSESDDSWDSLGKDEFDSSTEELSDSDDDEINLAELSEKKTIDETGRMLPVRHDFEQETENPGMFNGVPTEGIRRRLGELDGGPVPRPSWLPVELQPEHSASVARSKSPGLGSAWDSERSGHQEGTASPSSSSFLHSRFPDQSNNAIQTVGSSDSNDIFVRYDSMVEPNGASQSGHPESDPSLNVGDYPLSTTSEHATGVAESLTDDQVADNGDSHESEYLAATYDRVRRRELRRQRQARMRERVEQTRQRMRELDLERKRWLPRRMLRMLRRFYSESGLVQSRYGAVLSTAVLVMIVLGCSRIAYNYWYA